MKITVSGQTGTGSSTIAKLLAEKLGYDYYTSGEMFREMAHEMRMSMEEFEDYADEHTEYDMELDKRQREYGATHDSFVAESRLGWHLIPDSYKVMVRADETTRVQRVMQKEGVDEEGAKKHIAERERAAQKRFSQLYGIEDVFGKDNFDLVLDSSDKSPEELADEIAAVVSGSKE